MAKRPGLTLEEHDQLGAELRQMRNRLLTISVQLSNRYTKPFGRQCDQAIAALDKLRSDLEGQMSHENPRLEEPTRVYYGAMKAEPIASTDLRIGDRVRDRRAREAWRRDGTITEFEGEDHCWVMFDYEARDGTRALIPRSALCPLPPDR